MKAIEFVSRVRARAQIESVDEALRASRATLATLSERLKGSEPDHLAAQLPPEIGHFLRGENAGRGLRLSATEFIQRVSEREGVDPDTARDHARVIIEILMEAVSGGEMDDVIAQLPPDYAGLFGGTLRRH